VLGVWWNLALTPGGLCVALGNLGSQGTMSFLSGLCVAQLNSLCPGWPRLRGQNEGQGPAPGWARLSPQSRRAGSWQGQGGNLPNSSSPPTTSREAAGQPPATRKASCVPLLPYPWLPTPSTVKGPSPWQAEQTGWAMVHPGCLNSHDPIGWAASRPVLGKTLSTLWGEAPQGARHSGQGQDLGGCSHHPFISGTC
jgi:hypothetical protein